MYGINYAREVRRSRRRIPGIEASERDVKSVHPGQQPAGSSRAVTPTTVSVVSSRTPPGRRWLMQLVHQYRSRRPLNYFALLYTVNPDAGSKASREMIQKGENLFDRVLPLAPPFNRSYGLWWPTQNPEHDSINAPAKRHSHKE